MKKLAVLLALGACGTPVLDAPTQAGAPSIGRFVADVSPELSPGAQAVAANCGAQTTTAEELQRLAEMDALDAASTSLIAEIMTRDGTLACLNANGVTL